MTKLFNKILLSFKMTIGQMLLIVSMPIILGLLSYLYMLKQPDIYRVYINVNLEVIDKKAELKNTACTAYLSSDVFKNMDKKAKIADYWLGGLTFFGWQPDHSCFDINSLLLIKHYLHFYNESKIIPLLTQDKFFMDFAQQKKVSMLTIERYIASQVSFLTRQDSMLLTIALKGYDIELMKMILKHITTHALIKTQEDVTDAWREILIRLNTIQDMNSGKNKELIKEAIESALLKDKTLSPPNKLGWDNQFIVEHIGPNKKSVTVLGVFLGLLLSFFATLFIHRK